MAWGGLGLGTGEKLCFNQLGKPATAPAIGGGIKGHEPARVVAGEIREKAFGGFGSLDGHKLPKIGAGRVGGVPRLRGGVVNGLADLNAARGGEVGGGGGVAHDGERNIIAGFRRQWLFSEIFNLF